VACIHWWLVETPRGPTSKGVCKLCGAEKEFPSAYGRELYREDMKRMGAVIHVNSYRRRGARAGRGQA